MKMHMSEIAARRSTAKVRQRERRTQFEDALEQAILAFAFVRKAECNARAARKLLNANLTDRARPKAGARFHGKVKRAMVARVDALAAARRLVEIADTMDHLDT